MLRSIPAAVALCTLAVPALAGVPNRQVQIRSVDFDTGVIELFNYGATDIDLSGWRFCSHDFDQARRYTGSTGFNGVTIEAGTSIFIHFDNDAPGGDPDSVNRSSLGGSFAGPLDQDAYGMQIYFPLPGGGVSFGNSTLIADHIQWNIDGNSVGAAQTRTAQSVSQSLWSANGDFIATQTNTIRVTLTDTMGGTDHSPADYEVENETVITCVADFDNDGDVDLGDFGVFGAAFGSMAGDASYDASADFDNDGDVDLGDFGVFGGEFGETACD